MIIRHNSGMWTHTGKEARQDADVLEEVMFLDGYATKTFPTTGRQEVVLDIGAHIGSFACMWHRRNPASRIICVEANPDNWECLLANVQGFATVVRAACTYEKDFQFCNSIFENGTATGGSYLAPRGNPIDPRHHVLDERTIVGMTVEEILEVAGFGDPNQVVHIMKLDCECSEYSILANTTVLPRTRFIVGEYHGTTKRWDPARKAALGPEWKYTMLKGDSDQGQFIYENTKCPSS